MKTHTPILKATHCLIAMVFLSMLAALPSIGTAATIQGQLVSRPLTPGDKTLYSLPSTTEVSGGLHNVAIGTAVYLEVEVTTNTAASSITNVTWALTVPSLSAATLTNSPLGTNVPVYEPADRSIYQVASRQLLRPDVTGQYTITATIATTGGTTNVTKTITAATYMGVNTCALCHSGGAIAENKVVPWQATAHSHIFTDGINGTLGFYSQSCLACHTVGYDTTASANNGGFDDVAKTNGWTFPTVLTNGNWAAMQANYPSVANLANIQCENCHGPGSQHAYALGDTNLISKTVNSGDCNQCHDAPTHHIKGTEWYISGHANTTRVPSGSASRAVCVGCHTSTGFIGRMDGDTTTNVTFSALGCQTCHEPHGETMPTNNPHLLRVLGPVLMADGFTVVTNAGNGALCLQCHHNRNGSVTNQLVNYPQGKPTWIGGSSFGPHDGPQGDMIEGVNAVTYGQNIPSSPHRDVVSDVCVGCHMQTVGTTDPAFLLAGGHTFHMSYSVTNAGVVTTVDKVDACYQCHGQISSFDFPTADYNGDGIIEGVQTEVQHLLDKLSTLLPNANGIIDGKVQSSLSVKTNWTQPQLKAAYNWQFVNNDGSKGVHNTPFAVGILKASIADLTGDSNNDGLPDAWQVQYFGSTTNANAAPNAAPAGDGVPNWLKYSLGLDPWTPGLTIPGGVVWANGKTVEFPGGTNTVRIYTAAEVVFDTEVGTTYQLQSISTLGGGWQNVGNPISGTGSPISYVTPTRQNVQQFYRVAHTP
jgi:hypothetical protein